MAQGQQSPWQRIRSPLLWTGGIVAVLTVSILIGYRYGITLWDWIKLLIVPTVIAGGGLWFNRQQRERELEIAERRTQDEALQAYLDEMSQLLIEHNLRRSQPDEDARMVARARTLTVLARLDGERKRNVVQFVYESGLIFVSSEDSVLDLSGADLGGVNLEGAVLGRVNLFAANLRKALLMGAFLMGANLFRANLEGANLQGANLSGANLQDATGVTEDQLEHAYSLEGATMPNGQKYEYWRREENWRQFSIERRLREEDREHRKEDKESE